MANKQKIPKYELLAPAGDFAMLQTAVNAGADAVYFGLKEFSLRANAGNFEIKDLDNVNKICKKYKIPFHVSTQASISNIESAKFYKKLGAERIILARELNLNQIKEIIKNVNIKVETFIHGQCVLL